VNGNDVEIEVFPVEYAEVYGVPFSFIPCSGSTTNPKPGPIPTRVRALEDRLNCEITFPRLTGYRYELPEARLEVKFTAESHLTLSAAEVPTQDGERAHRRRVRHPQTWMKLKKRRSLQEVAFLVPSSPWKKLLPPGWRAEHRENQAAQVRTPKCRYGVSRICSKSRATGWPPAFAARNTFPQLLLLLQFAHDAADRIYKAIVASTPGPKALKPILRPYDTIGTTRHVDFDTTRPTYAPRADRCHLSHVVADHGFLEQKVAQNAGGYAGSLRYVKNHNLGFTIPYTLNGEEHD